ncbi:ROK family protein [Pediococcus ethanolidurans]|uniref:ROK family protein n=1 Tax=Pediococcus ethanolidurans TaxID=319653 RepID=UPI0029557322|nr:ROK family protein [Pediococcus ethanolidurans]MDV7719417.1 ROK family protein [Pediococcus ethanolidurans]
MSNIGLIDIGGTTIKFAVWDGQRLVGHNSRKTPKTLSEFYEILTTEVTKMKTQFGISGVGISSPGAVNKKTGVIEGASALPYIHNFKIQSELEKRFDLKISMENDANCAALAELVDGAGVGADSLLFLVIGTGVGGSVIINHKIWHGAHLFGGEFGFTLSDDKHILSELGTSVRVAERYNKKTNAQKTGKEVFDLAKSGDAIAQAEVNKMYWALAKGIYNLQYSFDPEKIVIGGAVSNNPDLIPNIEQNIEEIRKQVKIASIKPDVVACKYTDMANLRGAVVDFQQTYGEL